MKRLFVIALLLIIGTRPIQSILGVPSKRERKYNARAKLADDLMERVPALGSLATLAKLAVDERIKSYEQPKNPV